MATGGTKVEPPENNTPTLAAIGVHCGFQVYIPYLQCVTARVLTNMMRSYDAQL
jgi:hypothetical protein